MSTRLIIIVAGAVGLTACVTVTAPVPMGDGRYLITLNARGGFSSNGELLSQSVARANAFCANQGLQAEVVSTDSSGVQMWTPQDNQVVFRCNQANARVQ